MRKIFGISLVSILTALPMLAGAEVVAGDPGATTSSAAAASATPKYALKNSAGTDGNAATAGYVKGAYNAIIKGINATQGEIDTINTNIGTYENTVSHLLDNTATQDGTVATIKAATSTEQIASSSVNITGVTTSSISATASGNVNLAVPVMDNWANDSEATTPVATTTSFSNLNVSGLSMSAPGTSNTATLTKTGISGTVNVVEYVTQAATRINLNEIIGNAASTGYGYRSIDGTDSRNESTYNITRNGEFVVDYGNKGKIHGYGGCSTDSVNSPWYDQNGYTFGDDHFRSNLTSNTGGNCWCQLDGYAPNGGTMQTLSAPWVFKDDEGSDCAEECPRLCTSLLREDEFKDFLAFRAAVFGSVQ